MVLESPKAGKLGNNVYSFSRISRVGGEAAAVVGFDVGLRVLEACQYFYLWLILGLVVKISFVILEFYLGVCGGRRDVPTSRTSRSFVPSLTSYLGGGGVDMGKSL